MATVSMHPRRQRKPAWTRYVAPIRYGKRWPSARLQRSGGGARALIAGVILPGNARFAASCTNPLAETKTHECRQVAMMAAPQRDALPAFRTVLVLIGLPAGPVSLALRRRALDSSLDGVMVN